MIAIRALTGSELRARVRKKTEAKLKSVASYAIASGLMKAANINVKNLLV